MLHRALDGERIDEVDALALLQIGRLMDIGQVAHALRLRSAPADDVTFIVDRNINYTNYCVTDCGFCAFYRRPGDEAGGGYLHSTETILEKIRETVELGGTAALLQGGHNPDLDIEWYVELFRAIKPAHPTFHLHALSPPEIQHIARRSKLSVGEVLARAARRRHRFAARWRRRGARRPRAPRHGAQEDEDRRLARRHARRRSAWACRPPRR